MIKQLWRNGGSSGFLKNSKPSATTMANSVLAPDQTMTLFSGSYRLVAVLNLLTYIVFRMFLFVWFGNKLWLTRDDMPAYVLAAFTIGFAFIVYISGIHEIHLAF